jgi:hypothetical protein
MLGLLVLNAAVTGAVSLAVWRHGLRRDMAPIPHGAVVVPARFPSARLLGSIFTTGSVLALVIAGVVSPAVLGAGVGAEAGLLWGANKISAFERRDGRQVLRPLRRRLGQPAHYTDLALQPDASCSAFVIAPPRRRRAPSATHL